MSISSNIIIESSDGKNYYPITSQIKKEAPVEIKEANIFYKDGRLNIVSEGEIIKELAFSEEVGEILEKTITIAGEEVKLGDSIEIKLENIVSKDGDLENTIGNIEQEIKDLESQLKLVSDSETVKEELDNLKQAIVLEFTEKVSEEITKLSKEVDTKVSAVDSKITEVEETIVKLNKDFKELEEKHDLDIETIVGDVIENMTDEETSSAYKTLKAITKDLKENEASITDLLSKIQTNKEGISENKSNIPYIDGDKLIIPNV